MSNQTLLKTATEQYKKKRYADTVRTTMQLMEKGDYSMPVMLLSAKALIGLTATDDTIWDNVFTTVSSIMDDIDSVEQYQQIRYELLVAAEDAKKSRYVTQLKALERCPSFDQHKNFSTNIFMHNILSIKISATMSGHSRIKALRGKNAPEEKDSLHNEFTDDKKYRLAYDCGVRIFEKAKKNFETFSSVSAYDTVTIIMFSLFMQDDALEKLKEDSLEAQIERLEFNQSALKYLLSIGRNHDVLTSSGIRDYNSRYTQTTNKLNAARETLKKQKEKEEKARFDAYWEAHKEEKVKLEEELQIKETLLKNLNAEVEDARAKTNNLQKELENQLPVEEEYAQQKEVVRNLETELAYCWFFQVKKKRKFEAQLAEIEQPKLEELEKRAAEERAAFKERIDALIAENNKVLLPKEKELKKVQKAVTQIRTELTMPR